MKPDDKRHLARLLGQLAAELNEQGKCDSHDSITRARRIAADCSKQTGKNREAFIRGDRDHSYGVRCALAGIRQQRSLGK